MDTIINPELGEPLIEADRLTKYYGGFRAIEDVSFTVRRGEAVGFLGPNGAGKSTTMKVLTGFLKPTSGAARLCGENALDGTSAAREKLGYLPEKGPLYDEMTPLEFLRFIAKARNLSGAAGKRAVERAIELCHIESVLRAPIETLSKGFRQRVGMAQAILHDPPCLILDEPTDGLDPMQKESVRELVRTLRKDKAILLSTHILEEVEPLCSRVIVISEGKIRTDTLPELLASDHADFNVIQIKVTRNPEEAQASLSELPQIQEVRRLPDDTLEVVPVAKADIGSVTLVHLQRAGWEVASYRAKTVPLETAFRNIVQASAT